MQTRYRAVCALQQVQRYGAIDRTHMLFSKLQYLPMPKCFAGSPSALAAATLQELPGQVYTFRYFFIALHTSLINKSHVGTQQVELYMRMNGLKPNPARAVVAGSMSVAAVPTSPGAFPAPHGGSGVVLISYNYCCGVCCACCGRPFAKITNCANDIQRPQLLSRSSPAHFQLRMANLPRPP